MTLPTVQEWVHAAGLHKEGREWVGACPCGSGPKENGFHVAENDGRATVGCRGCIDGLPQEQRRARFAEILAIVFPDRRRAERADPKPNGKGKVPKAKDDPPARPPNTVHEYRRATGELWQGVRRWILTEEESRERGIEHDPEHPNKVIRPTVNGYEGRRDVYRLDDVADLYGERPVVVVESEKDADRLVRLGYWSTTWWGGASDVRKTAWAALAGQKFIISPDADPAGSSALSALLEVLEPLADTIRVVDTACLPPKRNAADLPEAELRTRIDQAKSSAAQPAPIRAAERLRQFGGLPFMTVAELLTASDEGVAWLVDDMLTVGGLSMLVAKPKAGKSTLARDLARRVARGEPWLGRTVQRGSVLYIALEEQRAVVAEHFKAMGLHAGDPLAVYVGPPPANAMDALAAACEAQPPPALVIVDPLFRLVAIDDGNDYAKVTAALAPLVDLARTTGAHVLTVHHARKTGGDAGDETLGSTGLLGAVDCNLSLKRNPGGERYLSTLQRIGADMPETLLTMDPETMTISAGDTKAARTQADLETLIVDRLRDTRHAHTVPDLAKAINRREGGVRSTLRDMLDQGRVVRSGEGKSGDPHRFEIVDDV